MTLREYIWSEGDLHVSSELNGTDTRRTWTVEVRFRSFSGTVRKYGDLTPCAMAVLTEAATVKLIEAITEKHALTSALLAMSEVGLDDRLDSLQNSDVAK